MHGTNLWWFAALPNGRFEYRRATEEKMRKAVVDKELRGFTIVHPDNPIYAKELRKYNRRYIYLINSKYVEDLEQLLREEQTPVTIIAGCGYGPYSKTKNLLELH